jgi:trk system potassium uptake protein TrkH
MTDNSAKSTRPPRSKGDTEVAGELNGWSMKVTYRNKRLENYLIAANILAAALVAATFVMLFGFYEPVLPRGVLYAAQVVLLLFFVGEKVVRLFNSVSKTEFLRVFWYQIPLFIGLLIAVIGAGRFATADARAVRHGAVGIYLIIQVLAKVCRTSVGLAASGRNPTKALIASFLVLIIAGAGMLVLPRSASGQNISFIDALFTATSATCVTGLVVKDTGTDFSFMGQIVILTLIQLGGLGIIVFGAVFALLLRQALTVRESVAMQDLLSARTVSRIGTMIGFIFTGTLLFEALGTLGLYWMWDDAPGWTGRMEQQWFYSIFHSISAFCNAGFGLFGNSLIDYRGSWQVYLVIAPLIIVGGLGFSVLYDISKVWTDRAKGLLRKTFKRPEFFAAEAPKRLRLQSRLVLSVSAILIVAGMAAIMLFERFGIAAEHPANGGVLAALFQSVTARTAGFNTVNISSMSPPSRMVLILLMFIGGSPGSTAGGIKTVTFAVVVITVIAALRKRQDVEVFKRSIRIAVVGRAITVTLLFVLVLFATTLILSVTERGNGFSMSDIMFESASALGTVGLSTGITPFLTTIGKLIIIAVMLIGRLGPLTLLAAVTFDLKPIKYNYPEEAVIVG